MPDYDKEKISGKETIITVLQWLGLSGLFAYMFYRSLLAFLILICAFPFFLKMKKKEFVRKRKEQLSLQFGEMLTALISSLQAGYSIENAIFQSYEDIRMMFGEKSMMAKELIYIKQSLHNNKNLEDVLLDFANRSHISDIKDFAEVFYVAKRSGGNMPSIIRSSVDVIRMKMEVKKKIETMISAKKMEQNIMNVVPFAILIYINATSPGFFDCLYHNPAGILIMTVLFAIYLVAYFLAQKIIQIEMN